MDFNIHREMKERRKEKGRIVSSNITSSSRMKLSKMNAGCFSAGKISVVRSMGLWYGLLGRGDKSHHLGLFILKLSST